MFASKFSHLSLSVVQKIPIAKVTLIPVEGYPRYYTSMGLERVLWMPSSRLPLKIECKAFFDRKVVMHFGGNAHFDAAPSYERFFHSYDYYLNSDNKQQLLMLNICFNNRKISKVSMEANVFFDETFYNNIIVQ
jgi:hypothetical protein